MTIDERIAANRERIRKHHGMINPKFYLGSVCTRWHVYPQQQKEEIVAHDYHGFWLKSEHGFWFKSPVSYVLHKEITAEQAGFILKE